MSERKTLYSLILTMAGVVAVAIWITIYLLYAEALSQQQERLVTTVKTQARLIEAVARFERVNNQDAHPDGSKGATLSQIAGAHENYEAFGETGEFTLASRQGDQIVFLLARRHSRTKDPEPWWFPSVDPQDVVSGRTRTKP